MQEFHGVWQTAGKANTNAVGKVLSFELMDEIFILGCPTYEVQLFQDVGAVDRYFESGAEMCDSLGDCAEQMRQAFSIILESNPKLHDVTDEYCLVNDLIVREPAPAVVIRDGTSIDNVLMVFIKCDGANVPKWRESGLVYSKQPFAKHSETMKDKVARSVNSGRYVHPKVKDIEIWRYADGGENIH